MKTKNNVQKTITKSLAVIITLVLISITVNAQNFWRTVLENNSFSQIAIAMTDNTEASSTTVTMDNIGDMSAFAKYAVVDTEEALEIESWMTDDNFFDGTTALYETETEEALQIEDWMINSSYFDSSAAPIEEESEQSLGIEDWMTDAEIWKI
ncbi:MAG TPA: hypothetical protein VEP89_18295 [Draconibacterium sp.]|nr:hypothetical protein [Draconibacterium sp.]